VSRIVINFDGSAGDFNFSPPHPLYASSRGAWAFTATGMGGLEVHHEEGIVSPCTSNSAELTAALKALTWAKKQRYRSVTLRGDSEFVIKWLRGINRTTPLRHIAPLQRQIANQVAHEVLANGDRRYIRLLPASNDGKIILTPVHVPRGENKRANALCRIALRPSVASTFRGA
jgi:ribonuclease HI